MSDIFDTLITDRPDVNTYYNISDLNRVEEAVKQLAQRMTNEGYYVTPKAKTPTELPVIENPTAPEKEESGGNASTIIEPYLQSSGTQYIDTGIPVKSTIGFEVDFSLIQTTGEAGIVGGFNYGGYNHNFGSYNGKWITQYGNNASQQFGTTDANRHLVSQNVTNGVVRMDGQTIATGLTYYNNTSRTFRICCYNGGASYPTFWIGSMKIYACRFYDNGTLIRDFIPKLDDNGVACLFDKVESKYYYNAGTGTFAYGENVYTPVEYIESSGTQCIDTKFAPNNNSRVVLDQHLLSNADVPFVFGTWSGSISQAMSVYWFTSNYNSWGSDYGSSRSKHSQTNWNKRLIIDLNKGVLTIDGVSQTLTAQTFTSPAALVLLGLNSPSGINASYKAKARIYSCQIYDNGVLVRDYVPAVDGSGVALLYDRLNGVPYYNAGTGSFAFKRLAGEVEYIESTGTQYVDIGMPLSQNGYFDIDFQFTQLIGSDKDWILGTYNGQSAGMLLGDNGQNKILSLWSRGQGLQKTTIPITERSKFTYNLATGEAIVNGTSIKFNTFDPGPLNALLFRRSTSDAPVYARLYSFKYKTNYDNSKFDIDCVPGVDEDGVVCLYDKVTKAYFYNQGSGTFNAGAPIVEEETPDDGENEEVLPDFIYDVDPYIWNVYDIPTDKETARYLSNLFLIRRQIAQNQLSLPNDMEGFNYIDANNIEMMLFVVDNLVKQMIAQYRRCNTFRCGEGR